MVPQELKYTKDHEWVKVEGDVATIGITDHAQSALGDVVYVELPQSGAALKKGETFGTIESVKAASDCYMPISGTIAESNAALEDGPENVNQEPYGAGWMIRVTLTDAGELDDLLTAEAYELLLKEQE